MALKHLKMHCPRPPSGQFDLAVLDVMLHESGGGDGEVDGFELCKSLRDNGFDKPIIFVSAIFGGR